MHGQLQLVSQPQPGGQQRGRHADGPLSHERSNLADRQCAVACHVVDPAAAGEYGPHHGVSDVLIPDEDKRRVAAGHPQQPGCIKKGGDLVAHPLPQNGADPEDGLL